MSQENVELVYRGVDALNRRDLDAFLALCHPEIEVASITLQMEGGDAYRSHHGVRSWWEDFLGVYPDFNTEIEQVRELGNVTVVRVRNRGHGAGSEAPMEQTLWQVIEWRDNKVIWWGSFLSEAEALEAAGLRE
jgi:ketosteroid isomerase-like protein